MSGSATAPQRLAALIAGMAPRRITRSCPKTANSLNAWPASCAFPPCRTRKLRLSVVFRRASERSFAERKTTDATCVVFRSAKERQLQMSPDLAADCAFTVKLVAQLEAASRERHR